MSTSGAAVLPNVSGGGWGGVSANVSQWEGRNSGESGGGGGGNAARRQKRQK